MSGLSKVLWAAGNPIRGCEMTGSGRSGSKAMNLMDYLENSKKVGILAHGSPVVNSSGFGGVCL